MRVSLAPCSAADFEALVGRGPPARARVLAATLNDAVIGVGGFLFMPDGSVHASMLVTPTGRQFPAAILRAGIMAMRLARRIGLREVLASPDETEPSAVRFLERLGFVRVPNGDRVFVWRANAPHGR